MFEREFPNEPELVLPDWSVCIPAGVNLKLSGGISQVKILVRLEEDRFKLAIRFGEGLGGTDWIEPVSRLPEVQPFLGYADRNKTYLSAAELWELIHAARVCDADITKTLDRYVLLAVTETLLTQFKESKLYVNGWREDGDLAVRLVLARNGANFATFSYVFSPHEALRFIEEEKRPAA